MSNQDTRFLELLHKWRTGDFTRADEQEMRVLAADDPFRQEAMEGMLEHPALDHVLSVKNLQERIRGKKPNRRFGFPQILAVAATLALVFGAIWFFNIRPVPSDQEQMAKELSVPTEAQNEPEQTIVAVSPSPIAIPRKSIPQGSAPAGPSMDVADNALEKEAASSIVETKDDSQYNSEARDIASSESLRTMPQAPGVIQQQSTNMALPAERAKEEVNNAEKKKASKPAPDLKQQQTQADPQKKAGKAKVSSAPPQGNQPLDGWIAFRMYLDNNARLTPEAKANNVTGTVRLQFMLDDKNHPLDFKVIKGLGYGCDEFAIQLIKDASWIRVNSQVVTVDVPFVR